MTKLLLLFIRWYQKTSFFRKPLLKTLFLSDSACRFSPTCSEYSYQAIKKYGSIKGLYLSLKRIIHCNPFAKPKFDSVP